MPQPFAVCLYQEYLRGKTVAQLVAEYEIPEDRIRQRLIAASRYIRDHQLSQSAAVADRTRMMLRLIAARQ